MPVNSFSPFFFFFLVNFRGTSLIVHIGFSRWHGGKESTCNAGDARDVGLIPGSGRSPGEGKDDPLQYSCLENSMGRGAWWAQSGGSQRVRHD